MIIYFITIIIQSTIFSTKTILRILKTTPSLSILTISTEIIVYTMEIAVIWILKSLIIILAIMMSFQIKKSVLIKTS